MVAGSSELKKHAERQGHKKAMLGLQKQHLLTGFIQKKPKDSMDDKVKMAEIKLSAFITEHSLSFKAMDHMGELVKTVFPDSKIAEQSKENLIAVMQQESLRLIRCLCQNFMRPEAIQDVEKLNPMDPRSLLPLEEVYLGESCQELLQSMEGGSSDIKHLRLRCLEFYQTAVFEVKKRLPVSGPFYHEVQFVQPSTALSYEDRKQLPVLPVLQRRYTHLLPRADALQGEWRMLPSFFTESEKALLREKPAASFWGEMSKLKNFEGKPEFENIACLAKLVLTLPHSNAETERIFSLLTDVKTRKRNRLAPDSINAVLVVKSGMTARSETCTNFKVEKKRMKLFTSEIYKA
ncbi:uncharacterized protein LOC121837621 [Ixodes scapularis]|uniref:uncharacterized protein LOC121837621 n=1 Tax=Ixodes scapularis TaxID=6945 RepID=UPI001C3938AB|nr:uncharacterized protein LOC121837621 [Ixodes scapularis]